MLRFKTAVEKAPVAIDPDGVPDVVSIPRSVGDRDASRLPAQPESLQRLVAAIYDHSLEADDAGHAGK
jgi:hypothetical protein